MNRRINREIKYLLIVLSITIILFSSIFLIWNFIKADYDGVLTNIEKDHFTIEMKGSDPEVDYPSYDIYFSEETKIKGKGNYIDDLKEGQEIKVWIEENNNRKVAKQIKIIDEK